MNEPLNSLERLGAEFERVARDRSRPRLLRRRTILFAAAAALSISAVALAASGILTGEPVKNPPGYPPAQPHVAAGVVRAGSATLTALRVPDPAGGPDWGLRTLTTTRKLGCVQVGRVVDGRLGVLGQDSSFHNDGRFHELPANVEPGRDCTTLDHAGRLFIAMSFQGLPASGQGGACVVKRLPAGLLRRFSGPTARRQATIPVCPPEDMRILYYGTLGPKARSVTYEDGEVRRTAATRGPWGAYLVVVRPDRTHPAKGYYVPGTSPGSGLVAVTYRDGHSCRIRSPRALGGAKLCPRVGYVPAPSISPTSAQLAATVSARISPTPVRLRGPQIGPEGPRQWVVRVSFTARVPAGPRSFYFVTQKLRHGSSCHNLGGMLLAPIARDVRVGERVQTTLYVPAACRGAVTGEVRFQGSSSRATALPFTPADALHAPLVGTYTVRIPDR